MQSRSWNKFSVKRGFTLIETITAVGVISLVLPLTFAIFFVILRQQAQFTALKTVKSESENALYQIKNTIKTSATKTCKRILDPDSGVYKIDCTATCEEGDDQDKFYFLDSHGNAFRFFIEDEKIASESVLIDGTTNVYVITSEIVKVFPHTSSSEINPYLVRCTYQGINPLIDINFELSFNSQSYSPRVIYKTKLRLNSK